MAHPICLGKSKSKQDTKNSGIAHPNTCCHSDLLQTMIMASAFMCFCNTGKPCSFVLFWHRKDTKYDGVRTPL